MVLSFCAKSMGILLACAESAGVQMSFRLKQVDQHGYLSIIHAEKPTRILISASTNGMACLAGVCVQSVCYFACFFTGNQVQCHPLPAKTLCRLFMCGIPAVCAFMSLGIALSGLWPRQCNLFWCYMGAGQLLQVFRGLFDCPKHAADLLPLCWMSDVPLKTLAQPWLPELLISAIILVICGMAGTRRQDCSVSKMSSKFRKKSPEFSQRHSPLCANKACLKPKPKLCPQRQVFLRGLSSTLSVTNKTFI